MDHLPASLWDDPIYERALNRLPEDLRQKIRQSEDVSPLPDWPEKTRGVPNLCLRSALFGVMQRGRRRAVKGAHIASIRGIDIRYTGWQLDQGDFDVMVQAIHLHKQNNDEVANHSISFKVKEFLRAIGRQPGKSGREWLKDSFRRLTATAVEINLHSPHKYDNALFTYAGSLVEEFYYSGREQVYSLKINPKFGSLFDAGWTQIQWQQRLQLKTDLAKWLHGFLASHREPYPIKVSTYKRLCGSSCKRLVDYRRQLRAAVDELVKVGALQSWEIDKEDRLHVIRARQKQLPTQFSSRGGIALTSGGHSGHTEGA